MGHPLSTSFRGSLLVSAPRSPPESLAQVMWVWDGASGPPVLLGDSPKGRTRTAAPGAQHLSLLRLLTEDKRMNRHSEKPVLGSDVQELCQLLSTDEVTMDQMLHLFFDFVFFTVMSALRCLQKAVSHAFLRCNGHGINCTYLERTYAYAHEAITTVRS